MPTLTVEQAITEFNISAVQAVDGCKQPTKYTVTENNNRFLLTHPDGCRLDVPFEVIGAMTPEQHAKVFGGLTLTPEHQELMSELRGEMAADLPADAPLPEVTFDRALFTAATGQARFTAVRGMTRTTPNLPLARLDKTALNKRVNKRARGRVLIEAMKKLGVNLPDELALPLGDALHAMYSGMEGAFDNGEKKVLRMEEIHRDYKQTIQTEMRIATESVAHLEADVTRTKALREAAVAWRDMSGDDPDAKFKLFTKLMDSIDRVTPEAPPVPTIPTPNLEAPLLTDDLVAEFAALDAEANAVLDADAETPR
jgi:hypothetical protein